MRRATSDIWENEQVGNTTVEALLRTQRRALLREQVIQKQEEGGICEQQVGEL